MTLTTVRLLAPHFTPDNHREVLDRARHKSERDVELLVASLSPTFSGTRFQMAIPPSSLNVVWRYF